MPGAGYRCFEPEGGLFEPESEKLSIVIDDSSDLIATAPAKKSEISIALADVRRQVGKRAATPMRRPSNLRIPKSVLL
jgi:hypothetical protein